MNIRMPYLDELADFHGHLCPGLAIGYRATMAALERLGTARARDEELLVVVENDSCSVDAVQFLAGATFGKGNLYFRDWGKQVFTFARREGGRPLRVSLRWEFISAADDAAADQAGGDENELRQLRTERILSADTEELFDIREVELDLPEKAHIRRSVPCDECGEPVMETRLEESGGRRLCPACAGGREPAAEGS